MEAFPAAASGHTCNTMPPSLLHLVIPMHNYTSQQRFAVLEYAYETSRNGGQSCKAASEYSLGHSSSNSRIVFRVVATVDDSCPDKPHIFIPAELIHFYLNTNFHQVLLISYANQVPSHTTTKSIKHGPPSSHRNDQVIKLPSR